MPADYEKCINTPGSTKFTKSLPDGKYIHGCRMPGSKEAVWGEIKVKQGEKLKAILKGGK